MWWRMLQALGRRFWREERRSEIPHNRDHFIRQGLRAGPIHKSFPGFVCVWEACGLDTGTHAGLKSIVVCLLWLEQRLRKVAFFLANSCCCLSPTRKAGRAVSNPQVLSLLSPRRERQDNATSAPVIPIAVAPPAPPLGNIQ